LWDYTIRSFTDLERCRQSGWQIMIQRANGGIVMMPPRKCSGVKISRR
jgi:hypothetical protein